MKKQSQEAIFIKFLRASYKTYYHRSKKDACFVCGSEEKLELHHNKPLVSIVQAYLKRHNIKNPTNDSKLREDILQECNEDILGEQNLITLCKMHHTNVHSIFGKKYNIKVADKVQSYLLRQKDKLKNG